MATKYLKGQNVRVFYGETDPEVVACATNCSIQYSANLESAGTKDDTGLIDDQEVTSITGQITADALVLVADAASKLKSALQLVGKRVQLKCSITEGAQNREVVTDGDLFTTEAIVASCNISGQNKQNTTYSVQLNFTKEPNFDADAVVTPTPGADD